MAKKTTMGPTEITTYDTEEVWIRPHTAPDDDRPSFEYRVLFDAVLDDPSVVRVRSTLRSRLEARARYLVTLQHPSAHTFVLGALRVSHVTVTPGSGLLEGMVLTIEGSFLAESSHLGYMKRLLQSAPTVQS